MGCDVPTYNNTTRILKCGFVMKCSPYKVLKHIFGVKFCNEVFDINTYVNLNFNYEGSVKYLQFLVVK